jgi:hypothetical protein
MCSIVDSEESLDTGAIIAYASTLAIGVLGLLVFKQKSAPATSGSSKKSKTVETGTNKAADVDNEWLASANIPAGLRKHTKSN